MRSWFGKKKNLPNDIIPRLTQLAETSFKDNGNFKSLVDQLKKVFVDGLGNRDDLSEILDRHLIPPITDKKNNAEITTPSSLRKSMLDKIPIRIWTKSAFTIFEPACGKGGFCVDVVNRLFKGLKDTFPNEKQRYKHIVEKCLYFADINPLNIFVVKTLLDPYDKFKLNYHEGDTLKLDIREKWDVDGFHLIVSNPPFDDGIHKGANHLLWPKFVQRAFTEWVKPCGFISYVHPSLWRQPDHKIQDVIKSKQILYLEIHDEKDGMKTFKCNTRYDWYLVQNTNYKNPTLIRPQKGADVRIDLRNWKFIPNFNFGLISNLMSGDDKLCVMNSRSAYATDRKDGTMSKTKDIKHIYPVVNLINRKDKPTFQFSSTTERGMFGYRKVIFGSGATGVIIDYDGSLGLTE